MEEWFRSECQVKKRKKVAASVVLTIAKYEVRRAARKFEDAKLGATFKRRHVTEEQTCCYLH